MSSLAILRHSPAAAPVVLMLRGDGEHQVLRKQELNLDTRGKSLLVLSFSYFFCFSYLLEPPEALNSEEQLG